MKRNVIRGAGIGAALMYFFDPDRGRRRRALVRDQAVHVLHQAQDAIDVAICDAQQRTLGFMADLRARITGEEVDDEVLSERVRAKIGRLVRHPGAIEVTARDGHITLRGPVLADEVENLVAGVAAVRGVQGVENHLETHEQPGDVPGLQGEPRRQGERFELTQSYWSPTARLAAGVTGSALAIRGLTRGGILGTASAIAGLGLLARGITNLDLKRLTGIGGARQAVDIQKMININAPVDEVFAIMSHPENFPRFMGHVREVRRFSDDRSHWTVAGPGGVPINWETVTTDLVPNKLVAWKTVPGSLVEHTGTVRFQSDVGEKTRIDLRMSYRPPGGLLGHIVASLFASDPKHAMDEDLARLKSLLEHGKTTAHGETVRREK
jgi:uncharacterized membrane protein